MTRNEVKPSIAAVKELMVKESDALREIVRSVMQAMLEAEMDEAVGAAKGERTEERLGYRSGYYSRTLITRVGKLELRVPQDRAGRFSTELLGLSVILCSGSYRWRRKDHRYGNRQGVTGSVAGRA